MGGHNPYNQPVEYAKSIKSYQMTVHCGDQSQQITVDPDKIPYDHNGLPGSLLDILLGHDIELDHSCGGVCACSTCHIYVEKGLESCNEANEDEEDMLDNARALKANSRLACQCVPDGSQDVEVRVPEWNRNLAREGGH